MVFEGSIRLSKMHPEMVYVAFSQGNELEMMDHPKEWTKIVDEFVKTHVK